MPRGTHAQSIASNGNQKEDKTLLQHSQHSQHGEFRYISISERQRSRPCGQNLRVPFLRTVLPPEVEESARAMAATARQKRSYLHHQGEFQHQLFTFRSGHDTLPDESHEMYMKIHRFTLCYPLAFSCNLRVKIVTVILPTVQQQTLLDSPRTSTAIAVRN